MKWIPLTDERRPETDDDGLSEFFGEPLTKPVLVSVRDSEDSKPRIELAIYSKLHKEFVPIWSIYEVKLSSYERIGMIVDAWMSTPAPYKKDKEVQHD